jgi:thiol-disulfide isomerase/thioredoxin
MKRILFLVLVMVTNSLVAQQKNSGLFIFKGKLAAPYESRIYLSYTDSDGKYVRDSTQTQKGLFEFRGSINGPTIAYLSGKTKTRSVEDPNTTDIFLEPGTLQAAIEDGRFKYADIAGSTTQKEYSILQRDLLKMRSRWKIVMDTLMAVNKRSNAAYQELKGWVLEPYFAESREIEYAFFNSHPTSYITAYQLRVRSRDLTTDSLKLFYNRFPAAVKESSYGKTVAEEIEKRKIGVPGTIAAVFNTVDINGTQFSLADYKGKYVLLDFWASWCVPCRKANPHLKELYTLYNAKGFEVIGVSDDDRDNAAWKKAVAQDQLPWKHVLRGFKYNNGVPDRTNDINERYNISSLPTQILIDPQGKIIARYGEGGEDHTMLDGKHEGLIKL